LRLVLGAVGCVDRRVPTPTESYRWFIIDERTGER